MAALILSGGFILATPGVPDWRLWLIAGATAAGMLVLNTNPMSFLAAGGVLGAFY